MWRSPFSCRGRRSGRAARTRSTRPWAWRSGFRPRCRTSGGAGEVTVFINEDEEGVRGVLVVAEGAGDLAVQTELLRAAMTALDVPAASVEVFARSAQGETD